MTPKPLRPQYTYRAHLPNEDFQFIRFFGWAIDIQHTNKRPVHCGQCASLFPVGECVKHIEYRYNFFLCLQCAKELILRHGAKGFRINLLRNLQAVDVDTPIFTAQQVIDSIEKHAFTVNENGIATLLNLKEL